MNILIVTQLFWPENFRINDLAVGLKEKGHNVTVLTGIPNYPEGRFYPGYGLFKKMRQDYHGVKVIRVPLLSRGKSKSLRLALNYLSFVFFACLLAPFLCRGKFNLIFVNQLSPVTVGLPAIVMKKLKRIPILFWVLDPWPESLSATGAIKSPLILGMVSNLVRFIYRQCDRILVSSQGFITRIERMGGKPEQICYFPNWAEEIYQTTSKDGDSINLKEVPSGFRVMFAGNIAVAQDFPTILSAAEKLKNYPDIHWLIVGDGRMFDWVKKKVEERGLTSNFHLLGRYPLEAMPHFFALADVMLVTLKRDPIFALTVPGKLQSYLYSGRPVIAALDGEGGRLVAEAKVGLVCPAEDPVALANAVLTMYQTPQTEREKMGTNGKIYCDKNFNRTLLLDRLEEWMQKVKRNN